MPDVIQDNGKNFAQYRAGSFVFSAMASDDGRASVIVTHDNKSALPQTTGMYDYKNWDTAADAAWAMASRQMKA